MSVDYKSSSHPFNPEIDSPKDRPASLFIHVNPFLVQTDTDLILLDTGLGNKDTVMNCLSTSISATQGFDPEEVTLVIMSPCIMTIPAVLVVERGGKLVPSFPNAEHVMQKREWETGLSGASVVLP